MTSNNFNAQDIFQSPNQEDEIDLERLAESKDTKAEKKASGSLNAGIYWEYLKTANSPISFMIVLSFFILCQIALSVSDYWLSYW